MSSTSTVCRGLQSCLEHLLQPGVEASKQDPSLSFPWTPIQTQNQNHRPWNFIFSLTTNDSDQVYVHPLPRQSRSPPMSLEMCTECLGSESGTHIEDEFPVHQTQVQKCTKTGENTKTLEFGGKIKRQDVAVPPPLSSINGSYCVHLMRTHRENGRLVIQASKFPTCRRCLKAERGNGRLRLSLITNSDSAAGNEELKSESSIYESDTFESDGNCRTGSKLGWSCAGGRCNGDDSRGSSRLPSRFPIYIATS